MVIFVNLVILGESGNFGEYVVSCKSSESGNLNYLVIMMNVAIFVNVVILVDVANLLGHVIFENLVDLIIW